MKTIFSTLIVSLLLVIGNTQNSYSQEKEKQNYVVLTKNVEQLKPILLAAKALSKEDGEQFGNFEIIVCGKGIQEITNLETLKPHLEKAEILGAKIVACGFSLKKFNVDPKNLPPGITTVENGILRNFELQKKGYLSLEL